MAITEKAYREANQAAQDRRASGYAVSARYDRRSGRVVVRMSTGVEIRFPAYLVEGLSGASPEDLAKIEISPSGLGLHWPSLDVDLYLPGVIAGQFGSTKWMAAQLGAAGGKARTPAKAASARINGRKGGRPRTKSA